MPTESMEKCGYCSRQMGKDEQAMVWQNTIVCSNCHDRLSRQAAQREAIVASRLWRCSGCGAQIHPTALACPKCGAQLGTPKRILPVLLLCWFLGILGVHRFYVGKVGTGLLMPLTLGGFGLWIICDLIMIVTGNFIDREGNKITRWV